MESSEKAKILLVEDEPNIAKLFLYNLKKAGYNAEHAENGQLGFDKVKEFQPDLIISDIMMPEVDGFAFRKMLLADSNYSEIPFIFLTAKGSEDDILEGYDLEIEDYIIKTASAKVIMAKVAAILASKKRERSKAQNEVKSAADNMGAVMAPATFPEFNGYQIKHWHVPYQDVPGGDFIDYFNLSDDRIVIVLGDVMGKKWKAFYFAVAYAGYVRSAVRFAMQSKDVITPADILNYVNDAIYKDDRISDVFIALSILIVDNKENKIYYSGAGDLPVVRKNSDGVSSIQSTGLLLGFMPEANYENSEIEMQSGDTLFIFSDGILDSRNPEGDAFGNDLFNMAAARITPDTDPMDFIQQEFNNYTQSKYDDDVSLISIKRTD